LREGLVAVSEIYAAPYGSGGQSAVGPLAVWKIDLWERPVFGDRRLLHGVRKVSTSKAAAPSFQKWLPDNIHNYCGGIVAARGGYRSNEEPHSRRKGVHLLEAKKTRRTLD